MICATPVGGRLFPKGGRGLRPVGAGRLVDCRGVAARKVCGRGEGFSPQPAGYLD
ncbi:hypothetical protein SIID45300_01075 [Candidatus Magnetaquicoccaceae bacterium FCR-1]|uniref:Uncharacterized protein n=1 Tax=Candidatus Magnetaquiglobus chichijimensis TaxID=3141448 RepID=A0ABQ0C7A7_9PROT